MLERTSFMGADLSQADAMTDQRAHAAVDTGIRGLPRQAEAPPAALTADFKGQLPH